MKKIFFPVACIGLGLAFLSGCNNVHDELADATQYSMMSHSSNYESLAPTKSALAKKSVISESTSPQGIIGTQHGSAEYNNLERMEFVRLNKKPDSLLIIDYRDEDKVETGGMARISYLNDPQGWVAIRFLSDGWFNSNFPTYLTQNGRSLLLGERGENYVIELENKTDASLEIVISIDGLNTTDNQPATYSSRGYVIGPKQKVAVRGWTAAYTAQSYRFKFSDVDGTASARRAGQETVPDIGTMGFAIFRSKASDNAGTRGRAFSNQ